MNPLRTLSTLFTAILVLSAVGVATAGTVTHSATVPLAATNWSTTMTFPQFDPADGCLDSLCVSLGGHVQGLAKFESLDGATTTVTMNLQSTLTLRRPDGSTLVVTIPLAETSDEVTAFDGTIDFAGTSGKTYSDLSGDRTEGACFSDAFDLSLFTGTGSIALPVEAVGSSFGSGAGNLILQFNTSASSGAQVTYYYSDCPTPTGKTTWGSLKGLYR